MPFIDCYNVVVHQSLGLATMINVFQVERLTSGWNAPDIREAFIDTVYLDWAPCVHTTLGFDSIDTVSLSNPADFEVGFHIGMTGTHEDVVGPGLVAASIRFNRLLTNMRHGYKRISGLSEDAYTGNAFTGDFLVLLSQLATTLIGVWSKTTPAFDICGLRVVKRVLVPAGGGHGAYYRMPESEEEYVAYHPTSFYLDPYVSSQVSRKVRSGA